MANEFYITAGLPAQDNDSARGVNAFYITAGLIADDLPAGEAAHLDVKGWESLAAQSANYGE